MVSIPSEQLKTLRSYFSAANKRKYSKGEIIIEGYEPQEEIFFIEKGCVKIYTISDDGVCNVYLIKSVGDLMPVVSLLTSQENQRYYEALTNVTVRHISKVQFEADLQTNPRLGYAVLQCALSVARDTAKTVHNLEISDSRKRIISRLLFLHGRFGAVEKRGRLLLSVPVGHQDLADSLNMTRDTANRIVSDLAKEGLVLKTRGRIYLLDREKLAEEVAGV